MDPQEIVRRRSPSFVRQWTGPELHAVAGRFNRDRQIMDLSSSQEWLFDAIISELEYRRRRARPSWTACSCAFCFGPFPELGDELEAASAGEASALGADEAVDGQRSDLVR